MAALHIVAGSLLLKLAIILSTEIEGMRISWWVWFHFLGFFFFFSTKNGVLLFLKNCNLLEKMENQSTWILKSSQISARKMTCDRHDVEMPHALSISLGWDSHGKSGDKIQEAQQSALGGGGVRKTWKRMNAKGVELQLPHCASAAFLTRPGGGSEGVFSFFGQEDINSLKIDSF